MMTVMAVKRARCIGVTGRAIRLGRSRRVMDIAGTLALPIVGRVMTAFAVGHRGNLSVTRSAIKAIRGGGMMGVLDVATVTADTAGKWSHCRMAGSAIDRVGRIIRGGMMGRSDLALMAAETVGQIADIGVTFCTVAGSGSDSIMMAVLLGDEGVARGAVTIGGNAFVALVAEALRVEF